MKHVAGRWAALNLLIRRNRLGTNLKNPNLEISNINKTKSNLSFKKPPNFPKNWTELWTLTMETGINHLILKGSLTKTEPRTSWTFGSSFLKSNFELPELPTEHQTSKLVRSKPNHVCHPRKCITLRDQCSKVILIKLSPKEAYSLTVG